MASISLGKKERSNVLSHISSKRNGEKQNIFLIYFEEKVHKKYTSDCR